MKAEARQAGIEPPFPFRNIPFVDIDRQTIMLTFVRDIMQGRDRCAAW